MSELHTALAEYHELRRALGFKVRASGSLLRKFVSFAEQEGAEVITRDLALRWAMQPAHAQPAHWARRLAMVRGFAKYRSAFDPRTEIPPSGLLPHRYRRKPPYIYTEEEISRLLRSAQQIPSPKGLRAATYSTLFGLLAATGMRMGEPLALDRDDVDMRQGVLTIREAKFGKSRLVPIHRSTQGALRDYARRRDQVCPQPKAPGFFLSERGTRLTQWTVRRVFVQLSRQIGLRGPSDSRGPRLHDLRHRFAIQTLIEWYRAGLDVEQHMPELAAYLGHRHVNDTFWYLSAVPELLRLAIARLESADRGASP